MKVFEASIVFTTYNRKDILAKAIDAVLLQTLNLEIIVVDDASTDGTQQMMECVYPEIKYRRSSINLGPSYQRNKGAELCSSDIIFFLDDDTIVQDSDCLKAIMNDFTSTKIGAVTIPLINILQDSNIKTAAPSAEVDYTYHSFIAAAFAVKRKLFLDLNGFRKQYFYMGEEGDFCLRLLNAGYFVKAGNSAPVFHYQPANRISYTADYYGRRNDILFYYLNCSIPVAIPYIIGTIFKGLRFGIHTKRLKNMYKGLIAGINLIFKKEIIDLRQPLPKKVILSFLKLKKTEPVPLIRLEKLLQSNN